MVTNKHREFARAVVALAREHKMDCLDFSFRNSVCKDANNPLLEDRDRYEMVRLIWNDGRHGDKAPIRLETRSTDEFSETSEEITKIVNGEMES